MIESRSSASNVTESTISPKTCVRSGRQRQREIAETTTPRRSPASGKVSEGSTSNTPARSRATIRTAAAAEIPRRSQAAHFSPRHDSRARKRSIPPDDRGIATPITWALPASGRELFGRDCDLRTIDPSAPGDRLEEHARERENEEPIEESRGSRRFFVDHGTRLGHRILPCCFGGAPQGASRVPS